MIAAELYQKTLAGYEACLSKGDKVTLSRYCKTHHVNYRGLGYWMKKESIPKPGSGRAVPHGSVPDATGTQVTGLFKMVPLLIESPVRQKGLRLRESFLKGITVTTQNGLVVRINEISCVDLAELILSCNIR